MAQVEIGWKDLNDEGKQKVAEAYGHATPADFEANENYDLYPVFILELEECDQCHKLVSDCECQ